MLGGTSSRHPTWDIMQGRGSVRICGGDGSAVSAFETSAPWASWDVDPRAPVLLCSWSCGGDAVGSAGDGAGAVGIWEAESGVDVAGRWASL